MNWKFRAWDKRNEKMLYDDFIINTNTPCFALQSGDFNDELVLLPSLGESIQCDGIESDIYVGDILKTYKFSDDNYSVEYNDKIFVVIWKDYGIKVQYRNRTMTFNEFLEFCDIAGLSIKVAGNIYENSNLIEEKMK